jgi:hypothetical protein
MRKSVTTNRGTASSPRGTGANKPKRKDFPAYPSYASEEDIYSQGHKEDVEPEEISQLRNPKKKATRKKAVLKYHEDDVSDEYLDIPGAELDDDMEEIGSEDEENNYYSIGGDDHDNLEEDRDDY